MVVSVALIKLHNCRSVPSGRVGTDRDAVFRTNDQFREVSLTLHLHLYDLLNSKVESHPDCFTEGSILVQEKANVCPWQSLFLCLQHRTACFAVGERCWLRI